MKTLKDIFKINYLESNASYDYLLKEEAIKWIKYLQNVEQELSKDIKLADNNTYRAQVKWIKHFFNLTDEDLK